MKKILLGLLALSSVISFADQGINVYGKFGVDVLSRFNKVDDEGNEFLKSKGNVAPGVFLEVTKNIAPDFEAGLGLGYISRGKEKYYDDNDIYWINEGKIARYDSIPLYITGKYNFNLDSEIRPYVKADLGYSFNLAKNSNTKSTHKVTKEVENITYKTKFKNGVYASVGFGLEYRNFVTEIAYVHTTAKIKWDDDDGTTTDKYNNNALRLSLGYKFNF